METGSEAFVRRVREASGHRNDALDDAVSAVRKSHAAQDHWLPLVTVLNILENLKDIT